MESDAYRLGALVGRLLVLLIPIGLGVWLAIRWHRRGRRLGWLWGTLIAIGGAFLIMVASFFGSGGRVTADLSPEDFLVAPRGYQLQAAPAFESMTESQFRADPVLGEHLEAVAVGEVVKPKGDLLGGVIIIAVDPFVAGEPGQEEGFIQGIATETRGEVSSVDLEGRSVSRLEAPPTANADRQHILAWQHENLFIIISTADEEATDAVASAIMRALLSAP